MNKRGGKMKKENNMKYKSFLISESTKLIIIYIISIMLGFSLRYVFSKFWYLLVIISFIPGLIATLISQGVFHTRGAESLFVMPEVLITTFLFWLFTPWILLWIFIKKLKKTRNICKQLIMIIAALPLGIILSFFLNIFTNTDLFYFLFLVLFILSIILLIIIMRNKYSLERK